LSSPCIAAFAPAPPVYRTDPRAALAAAADAQDLPRAASLLCATPELLDDGLARWLWRRLAAPLLDDLRDGRVEIHDAVLAVLLRRVIAADLRTLRADADALTTATGKTIPYKDMKTLDLRKWDTKGIAIIDYEGPSGAGRARIDGLTYGGFKKENGEPAEKLMTMIRENFSGEIIEYALVEPKSETPQAPEGT
jgi:hypothetical protein